MVKELAADVRGYAMRAGSGSICIYITPIAGLLLGRVSEDAKVRKICRLAVAVGFHHRNEYIYCVTHILLRRLTVHSFLHTQAPNVFYYFSSKCAIIYRLIITCQWRFSTPSAALNVNVHIAGFSLQFINKREANIRDNRASLHNSAVREQSYALYTATDIFSRAKRARRNWAVAVYIQRRAVNLLRLDYESADCVAVVCTGQKNPSNGLC